MKKATLMAFALGALFLISCGDDDTEDPIVNEIRVGDQTYVGTNGAIADVGSIGTHYQYSFGISDGSIEVTPNGGFQFQTSSSFVLTFGAASFGPDQFQTGTFQFLSSIDAVPLENYFFAGTFVDISDGRELVVTGGTVTISGTSPNYTVQLDLTLDGDNTLTGAYVGSFEIQ